MYLCIHQYGTIHILFGGINTICKGIIRNLQHQGIKGIDSSTKKKKIIKGIGLHHHIMVIFFFFLMNHIMVNINLYRPISECYLK